MDSDKSHAVAMAAAFHWIMRKPSNYSRDWTERLQNLLHAVRFDGPLMIAREAPKRINATREIMRSEREGS